MSGDGGSGSDLALQLANLLKTNITHQQTPKLSDNLQINLKLNNQNYPLWTRMIRVAIGGKSKALLSHLTKDPPEPTHESYETWEQEDLIVFSWLIQNIEPTIAGNLTEYPTAKTLWDALTTTYSSGKDKLQVFNLHVKANELKQEGKTLEEFWIALQGVWGEIKRIDPNPMTCTEDIKTYSKVRSEQKLFQFLHGLNRQFDPIKREILRLETLPSAETAYATVHKEAAHQNILGATNPENPGIAAGLVAGSGEKEGIGLASRGYRRHEEKKPFIKEDKSHLKCEECGMSRHTKDQCFRIVGYPEWWTDGHKKGAKNIKSGTEEKKPPTTSQPSKGFGGVATAAAAGEEGPFTVEGNRGRERQPPSNLSLSHKFPFLKPISNNNNNTAFNLRMDGPNFKPKAAQNGLALITQEI
ncbi:ribonuclease H-like domain-containing protein [Artemisia annua]|uniref:Ribonuclease H-like domain-containing protein n=1 Tax=Artemisia annua TaxID=35608 RepID=A0A2U1KDV0_ARTAN|nr:ribonuclease H-like domain-containing protein [Artemisia annua]